MALKRILVPYERSKPSNRALEMATELIKLSEKMEITIMHVIPEIPIPPMFERPTLSKKAGDVVTITA